MNILRRRFLSTANGSAKRVNVELLYDIVSPYSYFQFEHLVAMRTKHPNIDLKYTPVFNATIISDSDNTPTLISCPNKSAYTVKDVLRISKYHKIPFGLPSNFLEQVTSFATVQVLRFMITLEDKVSPEEYESLLRAYFKQLFRRDGTFDMRDTQQVLQVALDNGLNESFANKCLQESLTDSVKDRLKTNCATAVENGAFGVPTTLVHCNDKNNKKELFFGSDRNQYVELCIKENS